MPWGEPVKLSPPFTRAPTALATQAHDAVKRAFQNLDRRERLVREFLLFETRVRTMAKTYSEMTQDEKWECRGYDTPEPCELCGESPAKIDPRFFFVVCRTHMGLTPGEFADTLKTRK